MDRLALIRLFSWIFPLFFCVLSFCASAQRMDGYVILKSGDTLRGKIKVSEGMFIHKMYDRVVFFSQSEEKKEYLPEDLLGYQVGKETYRVRPVRVSRKKVVGIILKEIINGYCSLYESYGVTRMNTMNGVGSTWPQKSYYLYREGETAHPYSYYNLRHGLDSYFDDHEALLLDIKNKKYRKEDIRDIVLCYNRDYIKL